MHQKTGSIEQYAALWAKAAGLPWEIGIERLTEMYLQALQVAHSCFFLDGAIITPPNYRGRICELTPPTEEAYEPDKLWIYNFSGIGVAGVPEHRDPSAGEATADGS